jgi:Holliday junction DNA helicase RuvB
MATKRYSAKIIGNNDTRLQLQIALHSAKKRNVAPPHILLTGAAGCGKTTTARLVAEYLGTNFIEGSAESLKSYKDFRPVVSQLDLSGYDGKGKIIAGIKPSILFLDEIHNLPLKGQEVLGIAMENFILPTPAQSKMLVRWLPQFTVIGATTNDGRLSKPFKDRFKLKFIFQPYNQKEAEEIITYHASRLGVKIDSHAIEQIAMRSRGTPRVMVSFLERCRDTALAFGRDTLNRWVTQKTFELIQVNEDGLEISDLRLLTALFTANKPVGEQNLSIILNVSPKTITNSLEPYLIQQELMVRAPRGREITDKGIRYLAEKGYIDEMEANRVLMERSY